MDAIFFSFTKPFPSQGWQELIFERVAKPIYFVLAFDHIFGVFNILTDVLDNTDLDQKMPIFTSI